MERSPENDERIEQIEILEIVVKHILYIIQSYYCPSCKAFHKPPKPDELLTGLLGPNLTAFIAALKSMTHASLANIQEFIEALGGGHMSKATVDQAVQRVSEYVAPAVEELKLELPKQAVVNADETGFKGNGKSCWVWVFVASLFTYFYVTVNRSSSVLKEILGDFFEGFLGADFHSS
jgi:transposase